MEKLMGNKRMNWNSLLLAAGFSLMGFMGKEIYTEVRITHDAVIQMVPRHQYDVEMTDLRARVSAIELYIQSKEKSK